MSMTLSEIGEKYGLNDDELVDYVVQELGISEEEARLMLAIERDEVEGDAIEE